MSADRRGKPTVLVTDAARGSAIAFIRSLGKRGWRVIAADSNPRSPGFRSRYTAERLIYPDPQTAPREFVSVLLDAVRNRGIDLVIPITDLAILPLSEACAGFEGICKLAMPEPTALQVVTNKLETLALAERLEVPVPLTRLVHTADEAVEQWQDLSWPVVLKPQASRLYRDQSAIEVFTVCYAQDERQLRQKMRRFEGRCPVLLQEYCRGAGQGLELLMHQGRVLAAFQHRRLREIPVNGGASAFRESIPLDPVIYGHGTRLLEAIRWTGLAMVEFKVGVDGPKLMEINGRVWGSLPLAVRSGMDFPGRLADLYLYGPPGPEVGPDLSYTAGVRVRNLELDLLWIAQVLYGKPRYPILGMPRRHQAVAALLGLLNPAYRFDILSLEDPRPGRAELLQILTKFSRKLCAAGIEPRSETVRVPAYGVREEMELG